MNNIEIKAAIQSALKDFITQPLAPAALHLLETLGYTSQKRLSLKPNTLDKFLATFSSGRTLNDRYASPNEWKTVDFLFQVSDEEIRAAGNGQLSFESSGKFNGTIINSYLFLAIDLKHDHYPRTALAGITREVNKLFSMPVLILFRHGQSITLAIINRRLNKRESGKDVLEKVTLIHNINCAQTHRAHIEILFDLSLPVLQQKYASTNFVGLHEAWQKTLDTSELNKRFFQDIANWYFWSLSQVRFPKNAPKDADNQDSLSLIRLITRVIFCWFLKEKGLLPEALFDYAKIQAMLKKSGPKECTYYQAILQNLFFATLNQEMGKREFRRSGQNFMAHNLYRYRALLKDPAETLKLLAGIPFMNGGLFECLDKTLGTKEKPQYIRIDGFSDRDDNQLKVPNNLFFAEQRTVDLSDAYGDNRFRAARVAGLIHIFNRYKFTVAENTPIEEEVALDPELLGKVFENLLAAYNPETGATARKQTGSFYTPREIVNYMVDESLIASLSTKLAEALTNSAKTEDRLRQLLAYTDQPHEFTPLEVAALIKAIDHLTILDPACGSGAFPMGILHKLVFVLAKLDPHNEEWKARQLAKAEEIPDSTVRAFALKEIEQTFGANELDYGRKLYLIENCIYGVDIQPIAVQISKLRFFISLVVNQRVNRNAENLGVRPLPNLETKFVAANTLIGIERPGQQMLRNLDIEAKEAELRLVRERHFLARTPTTKAKCREQDAMLRAELAELLKNDGWDSKTAKLLAAWDPYDQNGSAPFFDSEWMFGIAAGFDIAIGNPPYRGGREWKEEEGNFYAYFVEEYSVAEYQFDMYVLFWERALRIVASLGIVAFITPNTWLNNKSTTKLRAYILDNTRVVSILDCSKDNIFQSAVVLPIITLVRKTPKPGNLVKIFQPEGEAFEFVNEVPQDIWGEDALKIFNISIRSEDVSVRRHIESGAIPLEELATVKFGVKLYETGKGRPPQRPSAASNHIFEADSKQGPAYRRYLEGKDIQRFQVNWQQRWLKYGPNLAAPRDPELFQGKRLLFRRIVGERLIGAYCGSDYVTSQLLQIVKPFESSHAKALLGILNSSLMAYYFRKKYNRQDKTFPEIRIYELASLPIPRNIPAKSSKRIEGIVDKLTDENSAAAQVKTVHLEQTLDEIVYDLYSLSREQINIIKKFRSLSSDESRSGDIDTV
jgi:adenine-specific DNA-methyltransferase